MEIDVFHERKEAFLWACNTKNCYQRKELGSIKLSTTTMHKLSRALCFLRVCSAELSAITLVKHLFCKEQSLGLLVMFLTHVSAPKAAPVKVLAGMHMQAE